MNSSDRNRSTHAIATAERAHLRATGSGLGDITIYVMMRACNAMMNERLNRLLEPHALNMGAYITMMSLYSRPENLANPSELCNSTGETRGNMTRICDEIVERGWMRRVPNPEDRRRVDLSLTDEGMDLLKTVSAQLHRNAADFYKKTFTKAEKATLQQLLAQFSTSLADDT